MSTGAWIFMGGAWGVILVMTLWCFTKLLRSQQFHEDEDEAERDEVTPAHAPPDS
jgi:hypothetical protein